MTTIKRSIQVINPNDMFDLEWHIRSGSFELADVVFADRVIDDTRYSAVYIRNSNERDITKQYSLLGGVGVYNVKDIRRIQDGG